MVDGIAEEVSDDLPQPLRIGAEILNPDRDRRFQFNTRFREPV